MDRGEIAVSSIRFALIENKRYIRGVQRIELPSKHRGTAVEDLLCFEPDNRIGKQSILRPQL